MPFKKEMEKEAKKIILGFAFNPRGWGTCEYSMGKVLIIALYVTYYPVLFNFFKYLYYNFHLSISTTKYTQLLLDLS